MAQQGKPNEATMEQAARLAELAGVPPEF